MATTRTCIECSSEGAIVPGCLSCAGTNRIPSTADTAWIKALLVRMNRRRDPLLAQLATVLGITADEVIVLTRDLCNADIRKLILATQTQEVGHVC